ncbi:hereditary hemochromatosis protein-like [Chanos chanos]|uniref:Hereditary hemochromatosis protein-like n=1 Tax=Chanos chanos TaxID=29144 RepID=A0A6J2UNW8_CHACN|nr:hereditary hemochromatosis protein-like [Chanos chanos]
MSKLQMFLCWLTYPVIVSADSHSLFALGTFITGNTPFPEFSVTVMLDDTQIGYYDSTTWKYTCLRCQNSGSADKDAKPRVRLLRTTLTESGRVQVSCLATGFYPRHINLTLFRDGQPVSEDQVIGGILLPNCDGTYQMRKSLEISAEELRVRDYTCSVIHLSLNNSLDISFGFNPSAESKYSAAASEL